MRMLVSDAEAVFPPIAASSRVTTEDERRFVDDKGKGLFRH
jgi:hypothetical protein